MDAEGFARLVEADPDRLKQWAAIVESASEQDLPALHNIGLVIARQLARRDGARAAALFRTLARSKPWVRLVSGRAQTPLQITSVWGAAGVAEIADVCFERLDRARGDERLALEISAAHAANHAALLETYVTSRLARGEPRWIARALTVCAFGDNTPALRGRLEMWCGKAGYLGAVARGGLAVYDRNIWARHWAQRCADAADIEEYWQASILLFDAVDFRFELWWPPARPGTAFAAYEASLIAEATRRSRKRAEKRKDQLFCGSMPSLGLD